MDRADSDGDLDCEEWALERDGERDGDCEGRGDMYPKGPVGPISGE